jgi:hypothetical protein
MEISGNNEKNYESGGQYQITHATTGVEIARCPPQDD